MKGVPIFACLFSFACSSDPPVISSVTVNPSSVAAGTDVSVTVSVENFELREPIEEGAALRAAAEEEDEGPAESSDYPDGGHFHIYLDSVETNPMLVNCPEYCDHGAYTTPARARVPDDVTPGSHTVIVRLNNDHHMFLNPAIQQTASLTVTSSSS